MAPVLQYGVEAADEKDAAGKESFRIVLYSSIIFKRALALLRNHCLVQMASKKARRMTTTAASQGTSANHILIRVHHGSTPT
jgi:hypothetical protein